MKFAISSSADSFQISILTPLPGTELFDKISSENRLIYTNLPEEWSRYDYFEPTIKHPTLTSVELNNLVFDAKKKIFSYPHILFKGIRTLFNTKEFITTWMLALNYLHYRNIFLNGSKPRK